MSIISNAAKKVLERDKIMAKLLARPYHRPVSTSEGLFQDLISAIISQQISTSAARSVKAKFINRFTDLRPTISGVLNMSLEDLRSCGISRQKAGYMHNIAHHFDEFSINDSTFEAVPDEAVIKELTKIKGVGIWTVQMILMFSLYREDVFPVGDLGIQNAMIKEYNINKKGKELKQEMESIAEQWRPHRTSASLLLWNTLH